MSELGEQVQESIARRGLLRKSGRILVAVSGGVDSMVLLDVLCRLSEQHGWGLTVAHLNHRLRGRSSDADEALVRRTAKRLGLPVVVASAAVRAVAKAQKISIEMAARQARHEFLARTARRLGIGTVVLAHHADDQVELFFLRLLRGSGSEGLSGMRWRSASPADPRIELVRPLLDQPKTALRGYAAEHRVAFREDATNGLIEMDRNRIRHELLPLLRKKYQPALDKVVLRLIQVLGAEAEFVGRTARKWMVQKQTPNARLRCSSAGQAKHQTPKKHQTPNTKLQTSTPGGRGGKAAEGGAFERLPVALQRECVRMQLWELGVRAEFELIERLRLSAGTPVAIGGGREAATKCAVRDVEGTVRAESLARAEFRPQCVQVDLSGHEGTLVFGAMRLFWQHRCSSAFEQAVRSKEEERRPAWPAMEGGEMFDLAKIGSKIAFRHWRPGDRFQPIGMKNSVKLQDFFVNSKVPRAVRHQLIVGISEGGEIFWVQGMRIGEGFKVRAETNRFLQLGWEGL